MVKNTVYWLCAFASLRFNHSLPQVFDAQDYGTGVGGKIFEPPRKRSSPRRNCFLHSSLFSLGEHGGEILPMEKGLAAPLRRTWKFGSLGLCKGAGSTLLHIVGFSHPSLIAQADGRVVLIKRPTLCAQPHLKSVSDPFAALMRSFPPIPVLTHAAWVILSK